MRKVLQWAQLVIVVLGFTFWIAGLQIVGINSLDNVIQWLDGPTKILTLAVVVGNLDMLIPFLRGVAHIRHIPELFRMVDELHEKHIRNDNQ